MLEAELDLQITIKADDSLDIDLGSLRLHSNHKSYFLDVINSYSDTNDNGTITIDCELERNEAENMEIFDEDSEFDLEDSDLFNKNLRATMWIEGAEEEVEIIDMELTIILDGKVRTIKVIEE